MAGVAIKIEDKGFDEALNALEGIQQLDQPELLESLGRLFQRSTRNRIEVTKTSPDGKPWKANRRGTSTLYDTGRLAASIDYQVGGNSVTIGTGLVYSAIHQFGGEIKPKTASRLVFMAGNKLVFTTKVNIPARPYLGISAEDKSDALEMVADTISELLQ